jgi:hypothetical protein
MIAWAYGTSLALSAASFLAFVVFGMQTLKLAKETAKTTGNPADVVRQSGLPTPKELADLATAFGKAGPAPTAATLSVFFLVVALIAGGIIKVSVETDPTKTEESQPEPMAG